MTGWTKIIQQVESTDAPSILITVGAAHGSTPRETGTRMLVTPSRTHGTIGGGQLEFVAIDAARKMLTENTLRSHQVLKLPLGPELAQCCGGYTELLLSTIGNDDIWFTDLKKALECKQNSVLITQLSNSKLERRVLTDPDDKPALSLDLQTAIDQSLKSGHSILIEKDDKSENFSLIEPLNEERFTLTLFGAGHVGKAIVHALSPLPCRIKWVDSRAEEFPENMPSNVEKIVTDYPNDVIEALAPDGYFLVMTHSHQLDFEITAELLKRKDGAYLGLIGSETKRKRFFKRLGLKGFNDEELATVTCPIGLSILPGKHPAEIAISVVAEILQQQRSLGIRKQGQTANQGHQFG